MSHTPASRIRAYQKLKGRRDSFFHGKACVDCGSKKHLELDHIVPETKVSHNIWSWTEGRMLAEIKKCQVLCRTCHIKKTKTDLSRLFTKPIVHGTDNAYTRRKCRCDICKKEYSKRRRVHYLKTGN